MAKTHEFTVSAQELCYDVAVCGGGVAGAAAAVIAARNGAKTLLIESGGELGGDITKGYVPQFLDQTGKAGFFREVNQYLIDGEHTVARRGARRDENGHKIPGTMIETEYLKYYFVKALTDAGADIMYHSLASHVETENGRVSRILVTTEAGNYAVAAKVFIDATGNGQIAAEAGCSYEFGHPVSGEPQPASMGMLITGVSDHSLQTDSQEAKVALKRKIEECGVKITSDGVFLKESATDGCWDISFNYEYNVPHDDILGLSRATTDARIECTEVADALKKVPGFENISVIMISSHLGIREGKRISGRYRISLEDILSGAHFPDGICTIYAGIDVHSISPRKHGAPMNCSDETGGRHVQPYNIPYRALVAEKYDNLLLAGRCISGDFYAHASYRMASNCIAMGEAAGYAAALSCKESAEPANLDGARIREYMAGAGYEV